MGFGQVTLPLTCTLPLTVLFWLERLPPTIRFVVLLAAWLPMVQPLAPEVRVAANGDPAFGVAIALRVIAKDEDVEVAGGPQRDGTGRGGMIG